MTTLNHPNILCAYDVFEIGTEVYIVMPLCKNGDLLDHLGNKDGRLSEEETKRVMSQVISAIVYANEHGWCHRDLKLENIFLKDEDTFVIGDWGFASQWSDNRWLYDSVGSLPYASPEVIDGKAYHGPDADMWSTGCMLYTLLTGSFPFAGSSNYHVAINIRAANFNFPETIPFSDEVKDLIKKLLNPDRHTRIKYNKILSHPWLLKKSSTDEKPNHTWLNGIFHGVKSFFDHGLNSNNDMVTAA